MKLRTLFTPSDNDTLQRHLRNAKNRAQVEHRDMVVWENQQTHFMQVLPDDMTDPPSGWVAVATVSDQGITSTLESTTE